MKVLILYGTYSGSTLVVAEEIKKKISERFPNVTLKDVTQASPSDLNNFDLIVLGSCTWERAADKKDGQLHVGFEEFVDKSKNMDLSGKKFLVFGLGDAEYLHFCRAADYLASFVTTVKGDLLAEPLKLDRVYFNEHDAVMKTDEWVADAIKNIQ